MPAALAVVATQVVILSQTLALELPTVHPWGSDQYSNIPQAVRQSMALTQGVQLSAVKGDFYDLSVHSHCILTATQLLENWGGGGEKWMFTCFLK